MKKFKYFLGSILHNCIAHPAMCFLPKKRGEAFHDWTIKYWSPIKEEEIDYEYS